MSNQTDNQIKTGSYAVTTVYSMPWTKKALPPQTKRKRAEKKVVHEIFEKCSLLTKDQYWISIFNACARDKFPRGFIYKNGMMNHRRGNKTNRVLVPNTPAEAYYTCMNFFKEMAGLMSVMDRKRLQRDEEERLLETISKTEIAWKDIKIERVKELLISEYIKDLAFKHNLSEDEKKELTTIIKLGFMLKYFSAKNIVMSNGKIIEIYGLLRDNGKFTIDPKLIGKRPGRKVTGLGIDKVDVKSKLSPLIFWEKYLDGIEKKISGKNQLQIIEGSYSEDLSSPNNENTENNDTNGMTPIEENFDTF